MTSKFEEPNLQVLIEKIAREQGFTRPKFHISSATKPGENFISRVFRVLITDEDDAGKSLSVILKASSSSRERRLLISSDKLFRTETEMYGVVLPALNALFAKQGISIARTVFPGTPRCYGWELNDGSTDEAEIIVVEDKSVGGFSSVHVSEGFDEEQCRLILEELALLHASFMALRVLEPEKATDFEKLIYKDLWLNNPDHPAVKETQLAVSAGFKMLEEPYSPGNPVYDKLFKMVEDFPNALVRMNEVPEDVAVIAHGDCWSNNILFRYNEGGKPEKICLIDFQISRLCSPAVDLVYLLIMCTTKETRDKHYESLIKFYFDNVHKILRSLGCDPEEILPWDRLQSHLKRFGHLGVVSCFCCLPAFMGEWKGDIHSARDVTLFSDLVSTDSESQKRISKRLNDAVTDMIKLGYI